MGGHFDLGVQPATEAILRLRPELPKTRRALRVVRPHMTGIQSAEAYTFASLMAIHAVTWICVPAGLREHAQRMVDLRNEALKLAREPEVKATRYHEMLLCWETAATSQLDWLQTLPIMDAEATPQHTPELFASLARIEARLEAMKEATLREADRTVTEFLQEITAEAKARERVEEEFWEASFPVSLRARLEQAHKS